MPVGSDASARYRQKIDRRGPDECWPWKGATTGNGYGVIRLSHPRRMMYAHRFGWEDANGPIPDGMNVLHHCDNPPCQNPQHWFLGTQLENERDKIAKGRRGDNGMASKTQCKRGHPFDSTNTYRYQRARHCKACRRQYKRTPASARAR